MVTHERNTIVKTIQDTMLTIRTMLSQPVGYGKAPYTRTYEKYVNSTWDFPPAEIDPDTGYVRSLYHHLCDHLIEDSQNDELQELNKGEWLHNDIETVFNAWKKRKNVRMFRTRAEPRHVDGSYIYGEGEDLDGVFILLSTHNGYDMRTGFSNPHIFRLRERPLRRTVCSDALPECSGSLVCTDNQHEWYTYDGETFYIDNVVTPMFPTPFHSRFELDEFKVGETFVMPTCKICGSQMILK